MAERLEDKLQYLCAQWLRENGFFFFHTPNEGKRGFKETSRLTAMGLVPGVPDLCILLPCAKSVWVELKVGKTPESKPQKAFSGKLIKMGFPHHLIRVQPDALETGVLALAEILKGHTQ